MKISPIEVSIADIFAGFKDNQEAGVVTYGGNLNVRSPYQREFIYDDVKQEAVIHTIRKGFPLNVMYWAKNPDGTYELLDGQQRTLSFRKFIDGGFSVDMTGNGNVRYFHNMLPDEQKGIAVLITHSKNKNKLQSVSFNIKKEMAVYVISFLSIK